jgi:hypothetical protein
MSLNSKLTFVVISTSLLIGCSNKYDANEKNFLDALRKHYQNSHLCFEEITPLNVLKLDEIPGFQRNFIKQLSEDPSSNFGRIIGLEKAGLITKPSASAKIYKLTELGKKYSTPTKIQRPFQDVKSGLKFCYGKIKPNKVINWDNPNPSASSQSTIVTFKYEISDLADWAKSQSIRKSYSQVDKVIEFQNQKEIKQGLKITKNGWEVLE